MIGPAINYWMSDLATDAFAVAMHLNSYALGQHGTRAISGESNDNGLGPAWRSRSTAGAVMDSHTAFNIATFRFLAEPVSPRFVIAVVFALSLVKLLIVPSFYDLDMPVREIGFGFGAATQAVATTGSMAACPPLW